MTNATDPDTLISETVSHYIQNSTSQNDTTDDFQTSRNCFYWIVACSNWIAGYFELTVAIFLLSQNFKKHDSPIKSAFFTLLAVGYVADSLNSIAWLIGDIINYDEDNHLTIFSVLIQWYASYFEGFWELVLAFNRCTALAFPVLYNKLWRGYSYAFITFIVIVFPFLCNGYTFATNLHCRLYLYGDGCNDFVKRDSLTAAVVTCCMSFVALIVAGNGCFRARGSRNVSRVSRLLLIQTIATSTCQILCSWFFAYSSLNEKEDVYLWEAISAVFSFFQHYPGVIFLFFISPAVRIGYCKFYHLHFLVRNAKITSVASKATNVQNKSGGTTSTRHF
uniref:Serpentine receptor class gamma n=1 Tax=Panagrellus redivivus TaxID=6233 RepID=A0A7E4VMF8_PANRE